MKTAIEVREATNKVVEKVLAEEEHDTKFQLSSIEDLIDQAVARGEYQIIWSSEKSLTPTVIQLLWQNKYTVTKGTEQECCPLQ